MWAPARTVRSATSVWVGGSAPTSLWCSRTRTRRRPPRPATCSSSTRTRLLRTSRPMRWLRIGSPGRVCSRSCSRCSVPRLVLGCRSPRISVTWLRCSTAPGCPSCKILSRCSGCCAVSAPRTFCWSHTTDPRRSRTGWRTVRPRSPGAGHWTWTAGRRTRSISTCRPGSRWPVSPGSPPTRPRSSTASSGSSRVIPRSRSAR